MECRTPADSTPEGRPTVAGPERGESEAGSWTAALGLVVAAIGALAALGLLGVPGVAFAGRAWQRLFGLLAWPLALLLTALGIAMRAHRPKDKPLPWARVVGIEVTVAAACALASLAWSGTHAPGWAGTWSRAGGMVGDLLADSIAGAVGAAAAAVAWFAAGAAGALVAAGLASPRRPEGPAVESLAGGPREGADDSSAGTPGPPAAAEPDPLPPGSAAPRPSPVRGALAAVADPDRRVGRPVRAGRLPPLDIWEDRPSSVPSAAAAAASADALRRALASFGIPVEVVEVESGPTVTRIGIRPGLIERAGVRRRVRVSQVTALRRDLALALSVPSLRMEAPVPGRGMIGVELPNARIDAVGMRGVMADPAFRRAARASRAALPIGRSTTGQVVAADLASMPHLLVAGTTGSGKSVCITAIVCALAAQNSPGALRMVLVDPKRVEMTRFGPLPHLVGPVVHDPAEAVAALRWLLQEMDGRYRRFARMQVRDLAAFNRALTGKETPLPKIVLIVDEMADLMTRAPEEFEPLVTRLAQLGRATGIHMLLATQRPSVDVLTGLIKANIPARIAFAVSSQIDSRVIIDQPGAETLLGGGDMLFMAPGAPRPRRVQGTFVSDAEIERLVEFWTDRAAPAPGDQAPWQELADAQDHGDELYRQAVALCSSTSRVSASLLQRRLGVGYTRAKALYDRLVADRLLPGLDGRGEPGLDLPADDPATHDGA